MRGFALAAVLAGLLLSCSPAPTSPSVSPDAYLASLQAFADCLTDDGWPVEIREEWFEPRWTLDLGNADLLPREESDQFTADHLACQEQTGFDDVYVDYIDGLLLVGQEWQNEYGKFVDCLAAAGVTIEVGAGFDEVASAVQDRPSTQAWNCLLADQHRLFSRTEMSGP